MDGSAVSLLYAPFCRSSVFMPPLGLPTLAAYLAKFGVTSRVFDLNVRFNHWLRSPGGLYEQKIRERVARFRALQQGEGEENPETIHRLLLDLAGAPVALLERELGDGVVGSKTKDSFHTKEALPAFGLQSKLETELWVECTSGSIANTVTQAIAMHETLMEGSFGAFLATPETQALLESAAASPLIGIGVSFSLQLAASLALARVLRDRASDALIVLGGSQISLLHERDLERLARLPFVDAVSRYEGEIPLERLHRAAAREIPLEDVPNIVFEDAAGDVRTNAPVRSVLLDDLPTPIFSDDELSLYPRGTLPIGVTRGCYWGKCTFCDYVKLMAPGQSRYVGRNVERVVDEIVSHQKAHGANHFWLITEALPPAWAAHFSKEILRRDVKATFWSYLKNERKEIWTQDLLDLMAAAGIRSVTCGVESTTDRVLAVIDKGTTREVIRDNYERFARAGIKAGFNLIPDYPTTTLAEAADGIRFILEHRDIIPHINVQMFDLSVQSAVAGSPEQFGIEITEDVANDSTHGAHSLAFRRKLGLTDEERSVVGGAYRDLQEELARYHLTAGSRGVIEARDFTWERARIIMDSSCRALRSKVDLSGNRADVVVVFRGETGSEGFEVPAEYHRVVDLLTARNRGMIAFSELVAAYTADVLEASGPGAHEGSLSEAQRAEILDAVVELGRGIAEGGTGQVFANVDLIRTTPAMGALLERVTKTPAASRAPSSIAGDGGLARIRLPVLAH